ncbi:MAG: hypothetical protein QOI95_3437 [Acidimicrobiaceae bacterium]|jgi:hypothetical protein
MTQVSGTGRSDNLRPTSSRKLVYLIGLLVAVLGGLFVSFAPTAGAATEATVPPITDYATYPQAGLIPTDCHADGAAVLVGITYTITHDSVDRIVTDLSAEQLFIGDTVKMSWTDYASGCEGIGVSLAVKSTDHNVFVITDNQQLVSYQYCSDTSCGGNGEGIGNLTIHVPSKQDACNFQFDAVIGPPLQTVGPEGSYYSSFTRGDSGPNMLIGYSNGGKGECVAPTATATQSCTTQGGPSVDVAIVNPDPNDVATVNVLKDGVVVHSDVSVPIGGEPAHSFVPFGVLEKATVSVVWTDSAGPVDPPKEIFSQEFTFDCVGPSATITHTCAAGGVVVDFANNGQTGTQLLVTKGGALIDTVNVAANGTAQRTYPMGEDESATYRVTGDGYDSGDVAFTHDCVLAESTTTSTPNSVQGTEVVRGTTLPRTGSSSTLPMSTMAGLLLMTGGLLLALANRPMPTALTANTRSRGR